MPATTRPGCGGWCRRNGSAPVGRGHAMYEGGPLVAAEDQLWSGRVLGVANRDGLGLGGLPRRTGRWLALLRLLLRHEEEVAAMLSR